MSRKGFSNIELLVSGAILISITSFLYSNINEKKEKILNFYQNYANNIRSLNDSMEYSTSTNNDVDSILLQISRLSESDRVSLIERLNQVN